MSRKSPHSPAPLVRRYQYSVVWLGVMIILSGVGSTVYLTAALNQSDSYFNFTSMIANYLCERYLMELNAAGELTQNPIIAVIAAEAAIYIVMMVSLVLTARRKTAGLVLAIVLWTADLLLCAVNLLECLPFAIYHLCCILYLIAALSALLRLQKQHGEQLPKVFQKYSIYRR